MLRFVCPLIAVDDIATSRRFYGQLLGQKVRYDFGPNVEFEGNFSIHLKPHFQSLLGDAGQFPVTKRAHDGELYFEADDLQATHQRLQDAGVELIHPIREQPWGQRVMRLYDPDGHVIEIGESMEAAVLRFQSQGLSVEQISVKTSMPLEFVERAIQERGGPGEVGG